LIGIHANLAILMILARSFQGKTPQNLVSIKWIEQTDIQTLKTVDPVIKNEAADDSFDSNMVK